MKTVSMQEINAAIEMERRRNAPSNALALFRKITGKKAPIKKNSYNQVVCCAKVGWEKIDQIQSELKKAGIWTNSTNDTIFLGKEYFTA